jgi:hypothetical protein
MSVEDATEGIAMSAEAWSALAAVVGVIVTAIFQLLGWRRDRIARGMESIAALDSRFESPEFREVRRRAAAHLSAPDSPTDGGEEAVRTVLNFFEAVGFLYSSKLVTAKSVWVFFSSWLIPYYAATENLSTTLRLEDPNSYSELERLHRDVCKIERKAHPSGDVSYLTTPEALRTFLHREASLELRALPSTAPLAR